MCHFLLKVSKRISSSLTIPTVLTRGNSLPLSTFRSTKRMLSQKEGVKAKCSLGDEHRFVKRITLSWKKCIERNCSVRRSYPKITLATHITLVALSQ